MMSAEIQPQPTLTRDLLPVARPGEDRLPPMMFVAALFYALFILGVSFDIGILPDASQATSLEVTIVTSDRASARPDEAQYLAQSNQQGDGNTREQVRPGAAPTAPGQVPLPMERVGELEFETRDGRIVADDRLTTRTDADRTLFQPDERTDELAEQRRLAQALPDGFEHTLPLPEAEDPNLAITADDPSYRVVSVNAAASDIAPYLNDWKRRVERIGSENFPTELRTEGLQGNPTLRVKIRRDGNLGDIEIMRSSGFAALDQAALTVLYRAAPFPAIPDQLLEPDQEGLTFEYNFEFRANGMRSRVATREDG